MISRFHTEPSALPPRTFVDGEEPVPSVRRVDGDTDHKIGVRERVMFWKEASVGNAAGDDERFVNRRYYFQEFFGALSLILGIVEQ